MPTPLPLQPSFPLDFNYALLCPHPYRHTYLIILGELNGICPGEDIKLLKTAAGEGTAASRLRAEPGAGYSPPKDKIMMHNATLCMQ